MKINSKNNAAASFVVIAAMATTMLVSSQMAFAATNPETSGADKKDAVVTASKGTDDQSKALTELSHEGFEAMRALHAARIAIFNGDGELAKKMIDDAESLLVKAKSDAETIAAETSLSMSTSDVWIPIDGQIGLAETFVPTAEKEVAINKANEHIAQNDKKSALETLKLASIDVRYKRILLPLNNTEIQVKEAQKLINTGKFYEANLAMKLAEEGIISDTIDLVETATK